MFTSNQVNMFISALANMFTSASTKMSFSDLINMFISDSTNMITISPANLFTSDLANMFTSDLAKMFTNDLGNIFTSELEKIIWPTLTDKYVGLIPGIRHQIPILHVIKTIKSQHQRADIECIFDEVIKIIDFQHITKDSLSDRVNQCLRSNKLRNKINRDKDSFFFLNDKTIDMSIDMIPYLKIHDPVRFLILLKIFQTLLRQCQIQ